MPIPLVLIEGTTYTRILHKVVTNVIEVSIKLSPADLEDFRLYPKAFIEANNVKD